MNISHLDIYQFIMVKLKPKPGRCSTIREMMTNGNILDLINKRRAGNIRLVRAFVTANEVTGRTLC